MPPLILVVAGALGGTVLARWVMREVRRVNDELDRVRAAMGEPQPEPVRRLRRDPKTGAYWPE